MALFPQKSIFQNKVRKLLGGAIVRLLAGCDGGRLARPRALTTSRSKSFPRVSGGFISGGFITIG